MAAAFRAGGTSETRGATPARMPQHSSGASRRQCATIASWRSRGISSGMDSVMSDNGSFNAMEPQGRGNGPRIRTHSGNKGVER